MKETAYVLWMILGAGVALWYAEYVVSTQPYDHVRVVLGWQGLLLMGASAFMIYRRFKE